MSLLKKAFPSLCENVLYFYRLIVSEKTLLVVSTKLTCLWRGAACINPNIVTK